VERDLLVGASVGEAFPGQRRDVPPIPAPATAARLPLVLAVAGVAVAALDVGVAVLDRVRPPAR
jgi:hypothetical protein